MGIANNSPKSFNMPFTEDGQPGYLSINQEMRPYKNSVTPTDRYYIYCMHPKYGSCTFIVVQIKGNAWVSEIHPPYITNMFIERIGIMIENQNK